MARIRKTASIAAILKRTNYKLAHSTCPPDVRRGMADMLETILMDAGLYGGYGYITSENMAENDMASELPGVRYYHFSTGDEVDPSRFFAEQSDLRECAAPSTGFCKKRLGQYRQEFPDESRRFYYVVAAIAIEYRKLEKDGEKGFGARGRTPTSAGVRGYAAGKCEGRWSWTGGSGCGSGSED